MDRNEPGRQKPAAVHPLDELRDPVELSRVYWKSSRVSVLELALLRWGFDRASHTLAYLESTVPPRCRSTSRILGRPPSWARVRCPLWPR